MSASEIKITVLVDNNNSDDLIEEHGFSAWIEVFDKKILFDTGQGYALFHNASKLGINLATADFLVLSHGHYDHTGGIVKFLKENTKAVLYLHEQSMKKRYTKKWFTTKSYFHA